MSFRQSQRASVERRDGEVGRLNAPNLREDAPVDRLEEVVRDAPPKDPRVQTAVLLLRLCGQGKATHLLRTLPPALTQGFADSLDAATEGTLETLCRLDALTPTQREQLRLPLREGGLGLRAQASLREAAYLGS